MCSEFDFDYIFSFESGRSISAWGVISTDFVDRDAAWESDTSLQLL
jgi:hypothetical protein